MCLMINLTKFITVIVLVFLMCRTGISGQIDLLISAASSTTDVLKELITEFEKDNPDVRITTNFAGSGTLLRQIERGAPVDLFFSADQLTMAQAVQQEFISRDSIFNVAENQLIVVGRDDLSYSVTDLDGVVGSNVRLVAIGNPDSVPAGRYARAALEEGGLWERVSPHLIFTQNVRQCLDYVARGEVDLAFVYSTDVLVPRENVNHLLTINLSEPIVYPIGVLNSSNHPEESHRFIAFLKAEKAQEIIEINGFRNFLDLPR